MIKFTSFLKTICNKMRISHAVCLLPAIIAVLLFTGCTLSKTTSDADVVKLVKNYYLFNHAGEQIRAKVIERGEFNKDCNCYPVRLEICVPDKKACNKTFYLFKNNTGEVEITEFMPKSSASA
ncbi:MAG: hypothetical protein HY808_02570 [Nitrospirae bacterium]|nr:hypothetical protein [Nitrospirota bacterium]